MVVCTISEMGRLTLYVQVYESSLERLAGGVIFLKMVVTILFVYEDEDLIYEEEVLHFS